MRDTQRIRNVLSKGAQGLQVSIVILRHRGLLQKVHIEECDVFGANRGPRPSADGLVSVDGLGMAGHARIPRMAWPPSLKWKLSG